VSYAREVGLPEGMAIAKILNDSLQRWTGLIGYLDDSAQSARLNGHDP
jgi:hypothetical protein